MPDPVDRAKGTDSHSPAPSGVRKGKDPNAKRQWIFALLYALGAVVVISLLRLLFAEPEVRQVSYSGFVALVRADSVAEAQVSESRLTGVLKRPPGATNRLPSIVAATRIPGMDDRPLLDDFAAHGVTISGALEHTSAWYDVLLTWLLPLGLLALLYRWTFRRMARGPGGALTFGTNKAKIYDQSAQVGVTFADVAGVDEARAELVEVVDFLKNPGRYQKLGGHIPRGVLLVGPPGTGKTLLARAVAGEAGVPFFSISGSEFVEMFVGVGAARVRDLFAQAKQRAPCIIFIDELDAIGRSRATGRGILYSNEEREQTLGQLLAEMDGFSHTDAVIVLAATNAPETLDAALVRPGRFDRQIIIDRPDIAGREAILRVHARRVRTLPEVDWTVIAGRTPGMVGADLANVVNEAALLAARRGAEAVATADLEEAIDRVILGLAKKSRVMSSAEKERVAFHETGHALVAVHVDQSSPVHRVSIIPRSIGALGHTLQLPTEERYLMTKNEIEDRLAVMLGGRTAEELIFKGVVSTGAADDLEKATELAHQMVTRFGMSERLGPVAYGRPTGLRFLGDFGSEERNYSEETAREIDMETRRVIEEAYARAREILTGRLAELKRIGRELIQRETLTGEELRAMLHPGTGFGTERRYGAHDITRQRPASRAGWRADPVREACSTPRGLIMMETMQMHVRQVKISAGRVMLPGELTLPQQAIGLVAFAHGSGSSRLSPRNRMVAGELHHAGIGTLLFDLLTEAESETRANVFDMSLLADRLLAATDWLTREPDTLDLRMGYFGASTGAGAALIAAAKAGDRIHAVVSRGGRPDLARDYLAEVRTPTLLIVGGLDTAVLGLNRFALDQLRCPKRLAVVPGATHLFEEPGTLEAASHLARDWFTHYLPLPTPVHG